VRPADEDLVADDAVVVAVVRPAEDEPPVDD